MLREKTLHLTRSLTNYENIEELCEDKKITKEKVVKMIETIKLEINTPMHSDTRNYNDCLGGKIITKCDYFDAKAYFNVITSTFYELTVTEYKDKIGKLQYLEGMYIMLSKYPLSVIHLAFERFTQKEPRRPTPCDIIREIEGYNGKWSSSAQRNIGEIAGIIPSVKSKLRQLTILLNKTN